MARSGEKVIKNMVKYIEQYYPDVMFIVNPGDIGDNVWKGYIHGQPDILILEPTCKYKGLAMWVKQKLTKYDRKTLRKLIYVGYCCEVTDRYSEILMRFLSHVADTVHEVDSKSMRLMRRHNPPESRINTTGSRLPIGGNTWQMINYLSEYLAYELPKSAVIPGLGDNVRPDLLITDPDSVHNGLAIWICRNTAFYDLSFLSDMQMDYAMKLAKRSYITVTAECFDDIFEILCAYEDGRLRFKKPPLTNYERYKH